MVNGDWIKNRLEEIEKNKAQRLIESGKNPFWNPLEGENKVKIFIEQPPKKAINTFGQPVLEWRLVEPTGYVWQVSERTDEKIMKAIKPFTKLDEKDRPPFALVNVLYNPSASKKKDVYEVKLE